MSHNLRSSSTDSPWHPRDWEAHLLAGLLRSSRITVLYGEPGAGKTRLLHDALLPLLRRRATDATSPRHASGSGIVIPFPDRRQRHRDVEVAALFDRWHEMPLPALLTTLAEGLGVDAPEGAPRLVEVLDRWHRQRGDRFLLLLDQFEECLAAQARRPEAEEFIVQLTEVVNHPTLPVSVLISLRSDAETGLDRLRHRIAGFDRHWLRLPHWQRGMFPTQQATRKPQAPDVAETSPPAGHGFIRLDLTAEPESPASPLPAPQAAAATPERRGPVLQWLGGVVAAASIFLLGWSWLAPHPSAQRTAEPIAGVAPAVSPDRLARDLALIVPPAAQAVTDSTWPAGFMALSADPPLAIARYDALQAARTTAPSAKLQIVAPLFTEQVHLLVRTDSPIQSLHEMAGRRIAVDDRYGADLLTLRELYTRLVGATPTTDQLQRLAPDAALNALLDTRSVEAIAWVAPDPSDWLAGLDAQSRQSTRLLAFDPRHAGSQRVTQRYLPVARAADGKPALSVMAFLVTRASPARPAQVQTVVRQLCQQWPALQREGHPAWRRIDPSQQWPVGWPYAPVLAEDWRACKS